MFRVVGNWVRSMMCIKTIASYVRYYGGQCCEEKATWKFCLEAWLPEGTAYKFSYYPGYREDVLAALWQEGLLHK